MQSVKQVNSGFRASRLKRSSKFLGRGLAAELVGIVILVLAFGPARTTATPTNNTLELVVTDLGLLVTTAGMLLALIGTIGGTYYAIGKAQQWGYLAALIGGAAQLIGFGWDNILHLQGYSHFDEAHNTAIGGLILLLLASAYLLFSSKLRN